MQNACSKIQILQQVVRPILVLKEKGREGKMLQITFHIPFVKKNIENITLLLVFCMFYIKSWKINKQSPFSSEVDPTD